MRKTTNAFLVPTSMEQSRIAIHAPLVNATCLNSATPTRKAQWITEVKCGMATVVLSIGTKTANRRGTARKDTMPRMTMVTHSVRRAIADPVSATAVGSG